MFHLHSNTLDLLLKNTHTNRVHHTGIVRTTQIVIQLTNVHMKPIFFSITGYSILVAEMSNIENMDCVNIEFNGFSGSLYSYIVIAIVIISC